MSVEGPKGSKNVPQVCWRDFKESSRRLISLGMVAHNCNHSGC
jgi:hypothetical protein